MDYAAPCVIDCVSLVGHVVNDNVCHWWGMAREDLHFRLRIPEDLKSRIEKSAEENHRSMTAEIVARLEESFTKRSLDLSDEGIVATLKSASALETGLSKLFFFYRDVDLDGFITDQAKEGRAMEKTEAVEFILREYLSERGYVVEPPKRRRGLEGL